MILVLVLSLVAMRGMRSDGLYYEDANETILSGTVPGTLSVLLFPNRFKE